MANTTRAEMINDVLEAIGKKGAEQSARAADVLTVGRNLDSIHARLRDEGIALFETAAIPPNAYGPFLVLVALECAPLFQVGGEMLQSLMASEQRARRELAKVRRFHADLSPTVVPWF